MASFFAASGTRFLWTCTFGWATVSSFIDKNLLLAEVAKLPQKQTWFGTAKNVPGKKFKLYRCRPDRLTHKYFPPCRAPDLVSSTHPQPATDTASGLGGMFPVFDVIYPQISNVARNPLQMPLWRLWRTGHLVLHKSARQEERLH